MLDRLLGKQHLSVSPMVRETCLKRRLDDIVKEKGSVDEQTEADNLEPFERFPTQAQRDKPNEQGTTGVNRAAGGG